MRESRTSGFVRWARSNMCPYRDPYPPQNQETTFRKPTITQGVLAIQPGQSTIPFDILLET